MYAKTQGQSDKKNLLDYDLVYVQILCFFYYLYVHQGCTAVDKTWDRCRPWPSLLPTQYGPPVVKFLKLGNRITVNLSASSLKLSYLTLFALLVVFWSHFIGRLVCLPPVGILIMLKWYYDQNHIFPIYAILKHKHSSSLYEKKNAVYPFQISLFVPEIFKFLKHAN